MTNVFDQLCAPSIIYLGFSLISITVDLYHKKFEDAFVHFMSIFIITYLLDLLCKKGLSIISWLIVFIPFILMSLIITTIIFIFGINKIN
jgi:hypothetical protein